MTPHSSAASAADRPPYRALHSIGETAEILHASRATLYRLISAGKLDARKMGSSTRITRASIDRFVEELPPADVKHTA